MKTYNEAIKDLPACCICAVEACVHDTGETIASIVAGVEHEMTMYAEDQDGCITARERNQCARYLKQLKTNPPAGA